MTYKNFSENLWIAPRKYIEKNMDGPKYGKIMDSPLKQMQNNQKNLR